VIDAPQRPSSARWLEVTLILDEELAEPVADVLARFAPGGVAVGCDNVDPDALRPPAGPFRVQAYLPADENLPQVQSALREALWHLGQIRPVPEPTFRFVENQDWSESWKRFYRPLRVGRHLVIIPSWATTDLEPGEVAVQIDPGMAFGTGTHPSTQLCLELVEACVQPGMAVIDLGCGSGILGLAALRLGAARVLALDNDPEAIRATEDNARLNGLEARVRAHLGSLGELLSGAIAPQRAPLVLANILAGTLARMLEEGLARTLEPGGQLVLSGILREQSEAVEEALLAAGLTLHERRTREDWVALLVGPPA
jgi:ribosomal protein L11 methyltransferase